MSQPTPHPTDGGMENILPEEDFLPQNQEHTAQRWAWKFAMEEVMQDPMWPLVAPSQAAAHAFWSRYAKSGLAKARIAVYQAAERLRNKKARESQS